MKNIDKGSVKYLILQILTIDIFGLILYPLFDFLLCKFITNSNFAYTVYDHIISPLVFCTIVGFVFWLVDRKKSK